jgi:hypothetical protein
MVDEWTRWIRSEEVGALALAAGGNFSGVMRRSGARGRGRGSPHEDSVRWCGLDNRTPRFSFLFTSKLSLLDRPLHRLLHHDPTHLPHLSHRLPALHLNSRCRSFPSHPTFPLRLWVTRYQAARYATDESRGARDMSAALPLRRRREARGSWARAVGAKRWCGCGCRCRWPSW